MSTSSQWLGQINALSGGKSTHRLVAVESASHQFAEAILRRHEGQTPQWASPSDCAESSYSKNHPTNLLGFWFLRRELLFGLCRVSRFHLVLLNTVFHFRQMSTLQLSAPVTKVSLPETKRRRDSRVWILFHPNQGHNKKICSFIFFFSFCQRLNILTGGWTRNQSLVLNVSQMCEEATKLNENPSSKWLPTTIIKTFFKFIVCLFGECCSPLTVCPWGCLCCPRGRRPLINHPAGSNTVGSGL